LLASDLGGGKTTFTKGLAAGLGSEDNVSSPTFTVNKIYKCRDGLELHHFDFYRLQEAGVVGMELADIIDDPKIISVVEWGDMVTEQLPADRITITFERVATAEDDRSIKIELPEKYAYLREAVA
jgi:tRNA threonylcarbamoyladenosine biosynthesis protein TsaE